MNIASNESYCGNDEHALYIPDARYPDTGRRLRHKRAALWQEQSGLEAFGKNHVAHLVRRGDAQRVAT